MTIKTYKIKHGLDFHSELRLAKQVAQFAVRTHSRSSKDVKDIGLKSTISNQILKKYRTRKIKRVKSVKLTVPAQSIKCDHQKQEIRVPCLKLKFPYQFPNTFEKVNQIEIGPEYIYVAVSFKDPPLMDPNDRFIGIDLNATGHCAVVATPEGQVYMLGRKAQHIHLKYLRYRKKYQRRGLYRKLARSKHRESNIARDLNHKISKKIVQIAVQNQAGIKLEGLSGIRKTAKSNKSFRYTLNSWSYFQLGLYIQYKAKKYGVPVRYIEPAYTSQDCSRCGARGERHGKHFSCPVCGHTTHADINAAFNIMSRPVVDTETKSEPLGNIPMPVFSKNGPDLCQSSGEKGPDEGCTDAPEVAMWEQVP
jgi:putative transposase